MATEIKFPFGLCDSQTPTAASTLTVTITDMFTIITPTTMAADMTLSLSISSSVLPGARIFLVATSDTTARAITFSTGFTATSLAGVISKTKTQEFVYDGTTFKPVAAGVQIN